MEEIDMKWAHPSLAKHARKILRNIRRDAEGRMNVADMKLRFQRHAMPMLGDVEKINGREWAFLSENWKTVLKDWAMCAGIWTYCPVEDPKWAKMKVKTHPKRRKNFSLL